MPTGSPIMGILTEIFLQHLEKRFSEIIDNNDIELVNRYVDI